jgi:hypothetical protein
VLSVRHSATPSDEPVPGPGAAPAWCREVPIYVYRAMPKPPPPLWSITWPVV